MTEAEVMALLETHNHHRSDGWDGCVQTSHEPELDHGDKRCLVWSLADLLLDAWSECP